MNTLDATRSTKTAAITLIGMAGAGKSTIGVLLAKRLVKRFVDTDLVIQETEQRSLQEIQNRDGYLELRAVEARVLQCVDPAGAVVATGGSAVDTLIFDVDETLYPVSSGFSKHRNGPIVARFMVDELGFESEAEALKLPVSYTHLTLPTKA